MRIKWRSVEIGEMFDWFAGKDRVQGDAPSAMPKNSERRGMSWLLLSDGSYVACESEYDEGYSEYTPGDGIEPPSFWIGVPLGDRPWLSGGPFDGTDLDEGTFHPLPESFDAINEIRMTSPYPFAWGANTTLVEQVYRRHDGTNEFRYAGESRRSLVHSHV